MEHLRFGHLFLIGQHLSGVWIGVDLRIDTYLHYLFKRDRTTCSKPIILSKLNS